MWGDTLDRRHLVVDGDGFQATAVLESALRRLRHAKEPRQLWADAFCINQDDIKERNTQVPLMAEVYGQATRVLAWLGEDVSPSIAAAYRWANTHYGIWRLVREFQIHYLWKWTWGSGVIDAGLDAWAGVIKIFSHPYWTRMWTLQECMIPDGGPVLVCGPLEFPFQQLYHAVETTLHQHLDYRNYGNRKHSELDRDSLNWGEGNLLADMKNLVTMMNRPGSPGLLLSLFALTESCQCTVPHDHIYALYGLEPDIRTMYPPDYDKPLGQLAHETTIYLMRYGLSWFPSSRWCLQENPFKAGAPPSWVPDFTRVMRDVDSPHHYPGKSVYAHAIGDLFPCARHEKQDRSIQLSLDKTTVSASGLHLGRCDILLRFSNETMIVVRQLLDLFRMTTGNWESMDSPWREKVVPTKETMVDRVRRV
ncbi:HET domain-containing protein, partial [Candidatus Bathyarchaeota archaeon]|nr:HET domain-containing protein [Candidatus Bathyarchaeota archaeon]